MAGSTFGKNFTITTFGESHGSACGVVLDGVPAGIPIDEDFISQELSKRRPKEFFSTSRKEPDEFEILSGVYEGVTLGTPICIIIRNKAQNSGDYSELESVFRPGHADITYHMKYGIKDPRGGGRASGRETVCRVLAGSIAKQILSYYGIQLFSYTNSILTYELSKKAQDTFNAMDFDILAKEKGKSPLGLPDKDLTLQAMEALEQLKSEGDSAGGTINLILRNVPCGVGEPVFDKLESTLSHALMSIGAVKGIEFGDGYLSTTQKGSEVNDEILGFVYDSQNEDDLCGIYSKTNHCGGILGGISTGQDIIIKLMIKPTPSISKAQNTINEEDERVTISIKGRHDTCIVPRLGIVAESMAAVTLLDMILSRTDSI